MNIREIALNETKRMQAEGWAIGCSSGVVLVERVIAELAKQNEPVARVNGYYSGHPVIMPLVKYVFPVGLALYTIPPTAEQIANETAEAIALMFDSRDDGDGFYDTNEPAEIVRSGAWKEFKK